MKVRIGVIWALVLSGCSCGVGVTPSNDASVSDSNSQADAADAAPTSAPVCCYNLVNDCSHLEGGVNSPYRCKDNEICGYNNATVHCCRFVPPAGVPGCFCGTIYGASPCP
jgi:hypothetical protein